MRAYARVRKKLRKGGTFMEEKTGIDIDEDDLANLHTVGDIVAYIEKKK